MAGLDNGLLPFYYFGFCSGRSRLGGLDRCKGLLFGISFFSFCGRSVDQGGNKGWMEIGEGIGGVDLGPLFFF